MKLDAKTVARLREPRNGKQDEIIFDDALAGFGLRIRAGGHRSYIVQYRVAGRSKRVTIGTVERLTVDQARAAARKVLASVTLGGDPAADRHQERRAAKSIFRDLADQYIASREGKQRPRTYQETVRYLRGVYFKPLHSVSVDKVDRRLVADCVLRIEREHGQAAAVRARSVLASMFAFGMVTGLAERNPLIGAYTPDAMPSRDRVLSDAELVSIWRASGDDDFGRIIRLLLLTACRRGEVGGMTWGELDPDRGLWTLPSARAKNGRAHTLPLPPMAWAIVSVIPRRADRDQLFGDRAATGFSAWHIGKRALDARLGDAVSPWHVHDIRRSVATHMADIGVQPHVVEAVLNHYSGHRAGVVQVYNRSTYEREVRSALAAWSDHIHTLLVGSERRVLTLTRR